MTYCVVRKLSLGRKFLLPSLTIGNLPFHRFNSMDALLSLIGSGAKVNEANSLTGSTALHEAAAFGNKEIVEHLLKNVKADANASDFKAVTPLMHASGAGYSIICLLLLQYGAKIDISSAEGMTALHFAATNGDSYVTQQIVEAGKQALANLPSIPG